MNMLDEEEMVWLHHSFRDVLFEFDDFCRKESISYQIAFGTLLGAVRHQGFIPWDDDADILMTEEEFRKLQNAKPKMSSHYVIKRHGRHEGIFGFSDLTKTCPWDGAPVGFDIFIVKKTGSTGLITKGWQNYIRNRRLLPSISLHRLAINLLKNPLRVLMRLLIVIGDHSSDKNCWRYTEKIVQFSVFPDEKLFPSKLYLFEGRMLPGAQDAHWCLAHEYGADYMTPLPPKFRKSHSKKPVGSSNTCSGR